MENLLFEYGNLDFGLNSITSSINDKHSKPGAQLKGPAGTCIHPSIKSIVFMIEKQFFNSKMQCFVFELKFYRMELSFFGIDFHKNGVYEMTQNGRMTYYLGEMVVALVFVPAFVLASELTFGSAFVPVFVSAFVVD